MVDPGIEIPVLRFLTKICPDVELLSVRREPMSTTRDCTYRYLRETKFMRPKPCTAGFIAF